MRRAHGQGPVAAGGGAEVLLAASQHGVKGPLPGNKGVADAVPDHVDSGPSRTLVHRGRPQEAGHQTQGEPDQEQDDEYAEEDHEGCGHEGTKASIVAGIGPVNAR